MSIREEIARLTGRLVFEVNSAPLQRFQALMNRSTQTMAKFGEEYNKLAAAMNKTLKLKVDTTALDRAKGKLNNALNRELRSEVALANQKRLTFAAELSQQKLSYTGTKEQQRLVSSLVRSQQQGAVVAAKAHAQQLRTNGTTKQQLASQDALKASLIKQARLEAIVAKTRATTLKADANHLMAMSKTQRIQEQINRAAGQAHRANIRHNAEMASMKQAAAAKAATQAQKDQRFQWAQQRQQHWQANKTSPSNSGGLALAVWVAYSLLVVSVQLSLA
ncbi:hypothetical protein NHF39_13550 [Pseudomonas proteolytica]|nr:hypothetical protein [Pseudomonas proteolytica]USW97417.1 hypothetical protein NHF39_13550 [Pseudomonas proteolytica]USW98360.1 hypothetical protein NHF41_17825 [Pseudomonas proteolytica]